MQGNDRWPPATNPSARLRAARVMPQWITARGTALPPPPPPPIEEPPPPVEPEYEVIEFPGQQTYSNQPIIRSKEKEKKRCDLCGSSAPAVKCTQCAQQNFCFSCDEMYHRHPKRQSHVRKELEGGGRPPLPPKGEPPPPPVPPPRRNKRPTPRPTPTPPLLPPGPHIMQRESVSPKPGLMGSLKKIIGVRPQPGISHTMDRQNSLPPNSSLIGYHDQHMMNCNGYPDWSDMHRGHRAGSFSALNSPAFGHMMQAQSVAQLNCPGCHGHGMWSPWGGMPPTGTWQSSNFLNRGPPKEEWSDSDSDHAWQRERLRRFSTVSARVPRSYDCVETQSVRGGRRTDVETSSHKGGRRRDFDVLSNRGGRKQDLDTISNRGGRKQDFDTMSNRGGRRQDFDTMSLRGGRKSDLESSSFRSQKKYIEDRTNKKLIDDRYRNEVDDSVSSDERESDEDFIAPRHSRKVMSDLEDIQRSRRRSQPPSPLPIKKSESSLKKKNKRNERFTDTGRRRSSPVQYKYESPSGDENELVVENGQESNEKVENGVETVEDEPEEEELGPIPDSEWECAHCTFVNEGGSRVCAVCCKTTTKPKVLKSQGPPPKETQSPPVKASQSPSSKLEDEVKKRLNLEEKSPKEEPPKNTDKSEKMKEKRGTQSPERNRTLTSKGTSPPPQSISTQTYEEAGQKLKRATSLADYSDWKVPQRSASRQSLLSDTQSLPVTPPRSRSPEHFRREVLRRSSDLFSQRSHKRAGSQPPEYISTLVQKQVKQGLEMVKLLREAEEHQFSAEDLAVALLHCGDGDPIIWLQENWRNMIDTVVTLGTNYGQERKENTVGTISASEAREALRSNDGNVWAAVTECVEQRQRKYGELLSRGNFSREDIVTALTATHGNVEEAYKELNKNQLKPFLMRIWGPPQGADNDDGDFTKLAHGDVVGRGGKNSEEVSVDLSTDTNYERIQNWLEDHVYNSNKINHSQSMLQINLGGLSRSESEWRINPQLGTPNTFNSRNMHNSDVQRFLTNFYNSNNKSLFIKDHSISTLNLNEVNAYSNLNFSKNKEPTDYLSKQENDKTGENNDGEIETITIKLNPIIVKSEVNNQINSQAEDKNRESGTSSSESSSEESESEESESESESDKESHTNELSNDYSNTLKADNQLLNTDEKSFKESPSVSGCPSEKSLVKDSITRSSSESSSESFESVHSSVDDNHNANFTTQSTKNKNSNLIKGDEQVKSSRESSLSNDYTNVSYEKLFTKGKARNLEAKNRSKNEGKNNETNDLSSNESFDNLVNIKHNESYKSEQKQAHIVQQTNEVNISNELLHNGTENNKVNDNEESTSKVTETIFPNITKQSENRIMTASNILAQEEIINDLSSSSNDSEEKFVEVSTDEEIPFIEEPNETVSMSPDSLRTVPIALEDDSDNETNFHSSEVSYIINKDSFSRNKKEKDILSQNLIIPEKRRVISKRNKNVYNVPKSDSDINDEQSIEFSEESVDYNEGRHLSPVLPKTLRRDPSLRFSETNSDKDVSSIPTDSEKELYFDGKETTSFNENFKINFTNDMRNALPVNHTELLELLKKSLTKEDVVERLVTTLFASVLQASAETNNIKEHKDLDNSTNVMEKEIPIRITSCNTEHQEVMSNRTYDEINQTVNFEGDITQEQLIEEKENEDKDELMVLRNEIKNEVISQVVLEDTDQVIMNEENDEIVNEENNPKESQLITSENYINSEIISNTNRNQIKNHEQEVNLVSMEENINDDNIINSVDINKEVMGSIEVDNQIDITNEEFNENKDNNPKLDENSITSTDNDHTSYLIENESKDSITNLKENENYITTTTSTDNDHTSNLIENESKDSITNSKEKENYITTNTSRDNDHTSNLNENESKDSITNLKENENYITTNTSTDNDHTSNLNENESKDSITKSKEKENYITRNTSTNKDQTSNLNENEKSESITTLQENEKSVKINTSTDVSEVKGNKIKNKKISIKRKVKVNDASEKEIKKLPIQTKELVIDTEQKNVEKCADLKSTNSNEKASHKTNNKPDNVNVNIQNQETQNNVTTLDNLRTSKSELLSSISDISLNPEPTEIKLNETVHSQDLAVGVKRETEDNTFSPEREARRLLAEGLVSTYQQAEIAVQLKELNIEEDMILAAAKECNSLETAISFLQQECQLCAGKYSVKEMVSMLECEHRCCIECASNYFTLQITERNINDCVCPFCKEPDILHLEEDNALTYFSHLDIFLKGIVKENIHELFQRKLRDRTLMQDPNFKWCVKCSSGYIANPRQKRLMCPDCKAITCAKCMKPWEKEHEKMSCEEYNEWLEKNDPDHQYVEKHLDEHGVTCPNCKSKYILAKGGCMHLTCPTCKHEFCSGCTKPFLMGRSCKVSEYCEKLGLHSHHPRNCLFYLRDKEPEELEKLLEDNKIEFRRNDENDAKRCGIQMLRETSDGLVEGICGHTILKAGLCRTHYIESLVLRIRLNKLDPVKLLDFNEALQELRRHGKTLPERPASMSEFNYRQICYKVIEEEIPLE